MSLGVGNYHGDTPLHLASRHGFVNIVKLLLEYEAPLEIQNRKHESVLDVAHNALIKALLLDKQK